MPKFNFKLSLTPDSSTKTEFKTELKTALQFKPKVNVNNPVLNK